MTAPSVSGGAVLFALGSAACWGFGLVAAKASLDAGLAPTLLALVQLAVSVAALGIARPVVARASGGQSERTPIPLAAPLSGILEYAVTGLIFAFGIALTTAGNAALIGAAEPAVIVVLAILLLGETAGRRVVVLLTLVTVGLALLIGPDIARTGAPNAGDMLVLGSVVTGALYAILSRRLVLSTALVVLVPPQCREQPRARGDFMSKEKPIRLLIRTKAQHED